MFSGGEGIGGWVGARAQDVVGECPGKPDVLAHPRVRLPVRVGGSIAPSRPASAGHGGPEAFHVTAGDQDIEMLANRVWMQAQLLGQGSARWRLGELLEVGQNSRPLRR